LTLVGHHSDRRGALAAVDLLGEGDRLLGSPDRRALRADLEQAAQGPPGEVDVDRDPDRRDERAGRRLDQVEMLGAVDHDHGRLVRVLGGDPG
jgi:hypothetical protein